MAEVLTAIKACLDPADQQQQQQLTSTNSSRTTQDQPQKLAELQVPVALRAIHHRWGPLFCRLNVSSISDAQALLEKLELPTESWEAYSHFSPVCNELTNDIAADTIAASSIQFALG